MEERLKATYQHMTDAGEEGMESLQEAFQCLMEDLSGADDGDHLPHMNQGTPEESPVDSGPGSPLDAFHNSAFIAQMSESATFHALTKQRAKPRYSRELFYGILIDTGANLLSTAGRNQYEAYCAASGSQPTLRPSNHSCTFGMGTTKALGAVEVAFPVGEEVLKATFHVVDADIPFLLCLADMDRLGISYDNTKDRLIYHSSGCWAPVTRIYNHPFIAWNPAMECLFSATELRRLHRRFGHPSAEKLNALLRRTDYDVDNETRETLEAISRECEPCQRHAQAPRRFKFALHDEKQFNSIIFVDVCYIESRPVLHVVDEATNYQAARWLPNVAADTIWQALRLCWIDVYVGPPDVIAHDAGKGFTAGQFQASADMLHITTKGIPVESPHSMSAVERYHAPLRRAFNIIAAECPANADRDFILQAAVKACNDSVGPDGLIPTILVFGTIPRLGLPNDLPAPATYKRAAAVRKAIQELTRANAKRQVSEALRARNGPIQQDLQPGMNVLLWRQNAQNPRGNWQGPYKLVDIYGENCIILMPNGPTPFRLTNVRPFAGTPADNSPPQNPHPQPQENEREDPQDYTPVYTELAFAPPTVNAPAAHVCFFATEQSPETFLREVIEDDLERFRKARSKEMHELLNRGNFEVVPATDAEGYR